MLSKSALDKLSPTDLEMRRAAQSILRHTFKLAFDAAAERYNGIRIPVKPNNNMGTDAKPEAVDSRYDKNKKSIDFHYCDLAGRLNTLVGKRFSLARVEPLRKELATIWGEQVNLRLPFQTGLESWLGSQHMEVVLGIEANQFVVRGYSENWAHKNHLR